MVFIDSVLVLPESAAEMVAAVVFGNKIKKIDIRRIEGGIERFFPGIGDGSGGKPRVKISIIRRIKLQVSFVQPASEFMDLFEGIDNGGIAIKFHADAHPIVEDSGYQ